MYLKLGVLKISKQYVDENKCIPMYACTYILQIVQSSKINIFKYILFLDP